MDNIKYGLWVPSTVGHWHMVEGKPLLFSDDKLATAHIPNIQKHYYFAVEVRQYK